jgi:hypothetical protein
LQRFVISTMTSDAEQNEYIRRFKYTKWNAFLYMNKIQQFGRNSRNRKIQSKFVNSFIFIWILKGFEG